MDTAPHGQGTPRDGEGGMIKLLSIHGNGNGSTPILFGILRFPRLPQLYALLVSALGPIIILTAMSGVQNQRPIGKGKDTTDGHGQPCNVLRHNRDLHYMHAG